MPKDKNAWMNDQLRARAGTRVVRSDKAGAEIADALRYDRTTHEVTRPPEEEDQDANRPAS